jgi:hypothetical protein
VHPFIVLAAPILMGRAMAKNHGILVKRCTLLARAFGHTCTAEGDIHQEAERKEQ